MTRSWLKRAGAIACLVACAACTQVATQVAMMSVTPMIAAFASHLDQRTANQIMELDKRQDWPAMLVLAQAYLQREPKRSEWWFLQGYAFARLGEHAAAVESFEKAVRITPEDEGSWLAMGHSQSALGQSGKAIQAYRQALRYRPESAQAYLALAELYLKQGQPNLALPNFRESVRYDPDMTEAWYGLAVGYQQTGQRERRDEALQSLRKLDPAAAARFEKQYLSK